MTSAVRHPTWRSPSLARVHRRCRRRRRCAVGCARTQGRLVFRGHVRRESGIGNRESTARASASSRATLDASSGCRNRPRARLPEPGLDGNNQAYIECGNRRFAIPVRFPIPDSRFPIPDVTASETRNRRCTSTDKEAVDRFIATIANTRAIALDTEGASFHRFVDRDLSAAALDARSERDPRSADDRRAGRPRRAARVAQRRSRVSRRRLRPAAAAPGLRLARHEHLRHARRGAAARAFARSGSPRCSSGSSA